MKGNTDNCQLVMSTKNAPEFKLAILWLKQVAVKNY